MILSKNFIKKHKIYTNALDIRKISTLANKEALEFFKETHQGATPYEIEVFKESRFPFMLRDKMSTHFNRRCNSIKIHFNNYERDQKITPFMYDVIIGKLHTRNEIYRYLNQGGYFDFDNFLCTIHFVEYHTSLIRDLDNKHAKVYIEKLQTIERILR